MNSALIVSKDIRNEQAGDWRFEKNGDLAVASIPLGDWRMELLIQIHELVEAALCKHRNISDEDVTAFDALFEEERARGLHADEDEDGDDPRAPYRQEHQTATLVEMIVARELDVKWSEYEQRIYATFEPVEKGI